jgi:hypothetical protein
MDTAGTCRKRQCRPVNSQDRLGFPENVNFSRFRKARGNGDPAVVVVVPTRAVLAPVSLSGSLHPI